MPWNLFLFSWQGLNIPPEVRHFMSEYFIRVTGTSEFFSRNAHAERLNIRRWLRGCKAKCNHRAGNVLKFLQNCTCCQRWHWTWIHWLHIHKFLVYAALFSAIGQWISFCRKRLYDCGVLPPIPDLWKLWDSWFCSCLQGILPAWNTEGWVDIFCKRYHKVRPVGKDILLFPDDLHKKPLSTAGGEACVWMVLLCFYSESIFPFQSGTVAISQDHRRKRHCKNPSNSYNHLFLNSTLENLRITDKYSSGVSSG